METKMLNTDLLLQSLQRTNRLLRQRAIIIGVLMVIAWGVLRVSKSGYDTSIQYYDYIVLLQQFKESQNPEKFIEADSLRPLYFVIDTEELYYKLEKSGYTDRTPIVEAISALKRMRNEINTRNDTINIFGLNVPITPWLYLGPLIILILFHDFAEAIFYRKTLQKKAESLQIEDWEKGPELFGFHSYNRVDAESRFLHLISTGLIVFFLLCPLITSLLFIMQVFGRHHFGEDGKPGTFLMITSLVCFFTVLIDTLLIFYHENIIKFRNIIDLLAGKCSKDQLAKNQVRPARFFVMGVLLMFQFVAIGPSVYEAELLMVIVYCLLVVLSVTILYKSLVACDQKPGNRSWKAIRFWSLLINFFWLLISLNGISNLKTYHTRDIEHIHAAFIVFAIVTAIIAPFFYKRFISVNSKHINTL